MSAHSRVIASPVVAAILSVVLLSCANSAAPDGSAAIVTTPPSADPNPTGSPAGGIIVPSGRPSAPAAKPSGGPTAVALDQDWATAELVDVSTGKTFRIADHAGQVIVIETMAIWCSNCLRQQRDVVAALARIPPGSVVYVVLDVDPAENAESLADYRTRNVFEGRYAIAGSQVARALAAEFGDQVLNPPSTPMVVVGVDGRVTLTPFGHKSADQIVSLAEAHGA